MESLKISRHVRMGMTSRKMYLWQPWLDIDIKDFEFSYKNFGM